MKAAICTKYGSPEVIKVIDVKKPEPKENEVLIKIYATPVTSGDDRLRGGKFPALVWLPFKLMMGIRKLRQSILGNSFSGVVEDIGTNVTKFKVGDRVFGSTNFETGCHAEFKAINENGLIEKFPESVSFEDAAAILFGGQTALHFLRKADIKKGQKVLIHGASGALGTNAIQLAKMYGAEVTGVCSTKNIDLIKSIGADHIIDYTKNDFTQINEKYDVIFDTLGKCPFSGSLKLLNSNGFFLRAVHLTAKSLLHGFWTSLTSNKKVIGGVASENLEDMIYLMNLLVEKKLKVVTDKIFPLDKIKDAHSLVDSGHKIGNVVVTMSKGSNND